MERQPTVVEAWQRRHTPLADEAGVTLIELLAAIMIAGVGLMALLTLFPLGALQMASAIKDDRTAAVAERAREMSETGEALLARTMDFVQLATAKGSADPDEAGTLREDYAQLARDAAEIEMALIDLQYVFPRTRIQPFVDPLLMQIRAIERRIGMAIQLLSMIEDGKLIS